MDVSRKYLTASCVRNSSRRKRNGNLLLRKVPTQGSPADLSVNDAILHVVQHDLPFGGVGPSGMGHYHGREGFETFSKLRPVFEEGWISAVQTFMQPPYTRYSRRILDLMVWMKS